MTRFEPGSEAEARRTAFNTQRESTFYPKTDFSFSRSALETFLTEKEERAARYLEAFERAAPSLLPERFVRVSHCALGTFHGLFRVRTAFSRWVLRIGLAPEFLSGFELLIETEVLRALPPEVPAPEVLMLDLSRKTVPFDFAVMTAVPGEPVRSLEHPETQALPEPVLEETGAALARIHSVEGRRYGLLRVGPFEAGSAHSEIQGLHPAWSDYIRLNLGLHLRGCRESGAMSGTESELARHLFDRAEPLLKEVPSRLLHGDFGHHNILMTKRRLSGVVDWEDAACGDPLFDLAYWGTTSRDWMRAPFLRGYTRQARLPPDFEVRYWLYYLRIALSKTVHRHLFQVPDRPGRPPASTRIQKALGHLRKLL